MKAHSTPTRHRMDRGDLFWLAYLAFYFIDPLFRRSLVYWLECLGFAAIFVALYVALFKLRRVELRVACIVGMYLLGALTYPINSGAITFFIYAAALLPFVIRSARTILICFVVEALLVVGEGWLRYRGPQHLSLWSAVSGVFFIAVVGGSNIFFAQKQRANCKLRMAQEEIEALAAVAERERIARDLHDVLGHTLSVIVLKAELAGRLLARSDDTSRAAQEIADVERTARSALAEVRETIGGYRARGLAAEMDAARNVLMAAGVRLEVEGAPTAGVLRPAEETVLALALREAVTNVVRHAQARTCKLHFTVQNGRNSLAIEDDGQHTAIYEGNGLRGMRERVESLGGTFQLKREHGTLLLIELPAATGSAS
ncbi:MAG TPA: sensor histidine kinase [Acidobacteriaceae bacterium]|nr:sensor histidine kinase [Acidobacteriaceae bacterium]